MKAFYVMFVVFAVLLFGAPMASAQDGWPGCPWGDAYNPSVHGFVSECDIKPTDNAAAPKPAGLAKPAPAVIPEQGWPGCPWGYGFNPMIHGDVLECLDRPTDNGAAFKPAGLAAQIPAQKRFGPCGSSGESPDPLAWPVACLR